MAAPAILQVKGNKTFAPFSNLKSEQGLIQVWQAVSRASAFLEQGKRLENLSWRLWSLQAAAHQSDEVAVMNRGRVAGHILNRDKGAPVLLPQSGRPHRASCCKIDPSVPCVHKKQKSRGRPALAAGPSVPLRTPSSQTTDSGSGTPTRNAIASTSKITLEPSRTTDSQEQQASHPPFAQSQQHNSQGQGHQQKSSQQPLWPISSISPNAHLAPSPFPNPGNNYNSIAALLANASSLGTSGFGNTGNGGATPSAAQMMMSALVDSLLSAGVAPAVAAHALTENPSNMLNTLQQQPHFAHPQQMASSSAASLEAHTLPSTPMEWSGSMPTNLEELTRTSLAEMLSGGANGNAAAFGPAAANGGEASGSNFGVSNNLNNDFQQQPSSNMHWFNNLVDQQQSSSSTGPSNDHQDVPMQDCAPIRAHSGPYAAPSTSNDQHSPSSPSSSASPLLSRKSSNSGSVARKKHPKLTLERKLDRLRQQMQLGSPIATSPSGTVSPIQSEHSGPSSSMFGKDLASTKPTPATKAGKKKSMDAGSTGSAVASTAKSKGKSKAVNDASGVFDGSEGSMAGKSKPGDSPTSQSRGPLQTTSSSTRKAASTLASPAAPPDQAPPQCSNCGVKKTPLWRRCGEQHELLCNACGLYWAMHKQHRPDKLKHHRAARNAGANGEDDDALMEGTGFGTGNISDDDGPETSCSNCGTSTTPLWRKDREGNTVCNACGLFMKLHGSARPVKMRADIIKKRVRYENPMSPTGGSFGGGAGTINAVGSSDLSPAQVGSNSSPSSGVGLGAAGTAFVGAQTDGNPMDLDVALAQLRSSGSVFGASPPTDTPSLSSTPSLMGAFSSTANVSNGVTFAPFHPGNDTAGRLTTTAANASGFGQQQQQQQTDDSGSLAARQRQEQEQWAHAAGFLLPNEPMGDGFNFGQALWGCDPSVIGNWHPESSPCSATAAAALGLSHDPLANATHQNHATPAGASANTPMSVGDGATAGFPMSGAAPNNSTTSIGMLRHPAVATGSSQHASAGSSPAVSHSANTAALHNEPAAVLFPNLFDLVTGANEMDQGVSTPASGSANAQLGFGAAVAHQDAPGKQGGGDPSVTTSSGSRAIQHSASTPLLLRTPSSMGATGSPPV